MRTDLLPPPRVQTTAGRINDYGPANLPLAKLRTLSRGLSRLAHGLPENSPWREHLDALWLAAYRAQQKREIELATKADKGEVLWAFCSLQRCRHHHEYIRTPRTFVQRSIYAASFGILPSESIIVRDDALDSNASDLARSLEECDRTVQRLAADRASKVAVAA